MTTCRLVFSALHDMEYEHSRITVHRMFGACKRFDNSPMRSRPQVKYIVAHSKRASLASNHFCLLMTWSLKDAHAVRRTCTA